MCAVYLDETACILSRNGDPQTLQQQVHWDSMTARIAPRELLVLVAIVSGYLWSGRENDGRSTFQQALWNWAFCATPLFDSNGR